MLLYWLSDNFHVITCKNCPFTLNNVVDCDMYKKFDTEQFLLCGVLQQQPYICVHQSALFYSVEEMECRVCCELHI